MITLEDVESAALRIGARVRRTLRVADRGLLTGEVPAEPVG
ncbi:hypothetical protein [Streptomyces endophyticus]|uniref:Uncharacterized protein n=1 Tax=Streptomyces endophyticus TaxID=714166 RepID=A0ABU6FEH7_9ACTN|nr:hypothetical protein [Streptomyces endophyticus]MEB8342429.1 hypothetical protein [Streptomyces endophyticus]